jgi:MFS family permease
MRMQDANFITPKQIVLGSLICLIGTLFYCYEFVLRIIPGVLQSELSEAFGDLSASAFGQISALYYFAYSPMQLPVGILMDRFGPRRLLFLACLCCAFGSLMFSYSSSVLLAGAGRFLVGFGSSFAFVGVLSLAVNWLPKRFFSLVAGLMTTLGMMGLIYGEVKITEMAASMGLNYVLLIMVLIGFLLTGLTFFVVRDGPGGSQIKGQSLPEFFRNIGRVLLSPQIWLIGFVGACLYTSMSVFGELWGKSYLEQAHHLTKIQAAKTISFMFLGWGIGAPLAGLFSDWSGRRVLPLVFGSILSLICIGIILYCPGLSYTSLNVVIFLYGLFSGTEIIIFVMAKENCGVDLSGTVFAAANMIVTLGGVIFQPLVGVLLDKFGAGHLVDGVHVYSTIDYQLALSILPIGLLLVLVSAFFLKDKDRSRLV